MARLIKHRDLEPVINAAQEWILKCLISDKSVFSSWPLWTPENVAEVRSAFVDHPDEGKDDFSTKLKGQMASASPSAKRLMAEMVWALLLFPSNIKVSTKRQQVGDMWTMSGEVLAEGQLLLSDDVLAGIGSGGTGFNNHRWREMVFLISLVGDLKKRPPGERQKLLSEYEAFVDWIAQVPQDGDRQLRHMLRFFCFPDRVERMSSNRERRAVLSGFGVATEKELKKWSDRKLDESLLTLRKRLEGEYPGETLDFYEEPLRDKWKVEDNDQSHLLALYVGQESLTNLQHGLRNGIWGFKDSAKPEGFENLKPGDIIVLGSGYSGGSPRTTFDVWKKQKLLEVKYARVSDLPFQSTQAEWPDEQILSESDRYIWRIRFDPKSVRTLTNVSLDDDAIITPQLSECLRKSGSANGRGYILPSTCLPIIEDDVTTIPNRRFWVEKTLVEDRPDRKEGPHALGKALWSPQRAEGNRDVYKLMREVREGDIVFHFVDNKELRGVSVVASQADETFTGVEGTEWAGRASYRIPLREYRQLTPPIHRSDFLADKKYRIQISNMLEQHRGLFFNKEFNLNQGAYLTEAPIELVRLWAEIYRQKAGDALVPGIDLGSVTPVNNTAESEIHHPLDAKSVDALEQALRDAGVVVARKLVIRLLSSLVSKNLVLLTGLAGSGKTKIAQALARWLPSSASCMRVVAVGADWTGNENVLGYPNGLDKASYVSKPSLEIILHARDNQAVPHFLILDEMNLSHVERYFADILSAIESDEKIHLHQDVERKSNGIIIPAEVGLPKNLFIIGTVNVDETTYMFSPKVLDRSNVIEFRMDAGELEGFLGNPAKPELKHLDGKGASFEKAFVVAAKSPVAVPPDVKPAFDAEMLLFFKTLQGHGAEFGYRTAYETARFIYFYKLLGNHPDGDVTWFPGAFDCVVFQKLLPKLHGSRAKLGPVLKKLWFLCVNDTAGRGADALKAAEASKAEPNKKDIPTTAPYPMSAEKICRMWQLLMDNGFASFAEA